MAASKDKVEYYQDKRGEWRWRMLSKDGKVVGAACEGYKQKSDCEANAKRGKRAKDKWEFYQDKRGAWRWRRVASNGKVVGAAATGYKSKKEAQANAAIQGFTA